MKKINTMIIAVVAASLILVAGCYDNVTEYPEVEGYTGFVNAGWDAFEDGDYEAAMLNFKNAIDMDVSRSDAYVGAGWCSILLPDYWVIGHQYDFMAVQLDNGTWPVEFNAVIIPQNKDWSKFECVYPELTANDIQVINAFGDTILVVDGDTLFWGGTQGPDLPKETLDNEEIGDWLYGKYSNIRFQYKFEIDHPNVMALFTVANGLSFANCGVDSIVNGTSASSVYMSVPYVRKDGYRTWCMNENEMSFGYATFESAAGHTAFANDGVAAYGILQDAKGENGDPYLGVAALLGLADEGAYSFSHYEGIDNQKLRGMAAAMAYRNQYFRPALGICQDEGFGLDIKASDPDFPVRLMQAIETMLL
ncbi:MAG: hypothetical protein KAR40_02250 [Candidatus Sabulitectum sp.]|nr:hypothetical protein [Candidatus Sabulitectum sp.]